MRLPSLALCLGAGGQLCGKARRGGLGLLELRHRPGCLGLRLSPSFRGCPQARRSLVPPRVRRREERGRELVRDRGAGRLLLGLGGQPTSLRSELREDVVDTGKVAL